MKTAISCSAANAVLANVAYLHDLLDENSGAFNARLLEKLNIFSVRAITIILFVKFLSYPLLIFLKRCCFKKIFLL